MNSLLTLRGIQKQFKQGLLLDIDLLQIAPASAYALTGINGAGKTSLLRILCGLDSGRIEHASFLGKEIAWFPYPAALRAAIVYVHQHPIMFAGTVSENLAYGLKARGSSAAARSTTVEQALEWAGLQHLRGHSAASLSGGEKQRVALARAKILHPKLLLLDEPTSNLDGAAREQVLALIPQLIEEGSSVIMVCHDRELIALPGVQRLKLRDGKLEQRAAAPQPVLSSS